jgi:peptidoglycan/LPS O-acetylase OafA/YrhL
VPLRFSAPPPQPGTAYQAYLNQSYFPLLDGLRCIAIVSVVWFHAAGGAYGSGLISRGNEGVSLFFVISGFLITSILLREQSGTGNVSLKRFYLRRTVRIFPLYYAILALYVVLVFVIGTQSMAGRQFWHNLPYFLTYTSNWFVPLNSDRVIFFFSWSLATEEQFYFFWPWCVKASARPYLPIATMVAVLALHYGAVFATADSPIAANTWFFTRVLVSLSPPICLGAIAALLMHQPTTFGWIERLSGWRWSAATALAATLLALGFDATPSWVYYAAMTWLVVACVLRPRDQPLGKMLNNRLVKHIGIVSYGMYLMHMLCINVARQLVNAHTGFLVFVVALPLSVAVASISYRFFESKFLRLKERIAMRPKRTLVNIAVGEEALK